MESYSTHAPLIPLLLYSMKCFQLSVLFLDFYGNHKPQPHFLLSPYLSLHPRPMFLLQEEIYKEAADKLGF